MCALLHALEEDQAQTIGFQRSGPRIAVRPFNGQNMRRQFEPGTSFVVVVVIVIRWTIIGPGRSSSSTVGHVV